MRPMSAKMSGPSSKNQSLGSSATPSSETNCVKTTLRMIDPVVRGRSQRGRVGCELVEDRAPTVMETHVRVVIAVGFVAVERNGPAQGRVTLRLERHHCGEE